eukprot:CAMPEP_0170556692 /NCGR_PEP_ID=MMETSP0211-20121228/18169_1 /TAXON_ID=311385 /ORGANISM="Pseudokeronopsis sp., Strain OXSARD2" /LENGTH=181 /DNA_ID=CAMNT_0010867181 /DNA_START=15 /DNA_END=560 /DNA_ORIENTATION=+
MSAFNSTDASYQQSSPAVEIILNVYDLGSEDQNNNNSYLYRYLGVGFFHTAVEINGIEHSYGGNPLSSDSGVFRSTPLTVENATYRESYLMGTMRNQSRIQEVLDNVSRQFRANEYNMICQNCNHFTEAFTLELLGKRIPSYINRAARVAHLFSAFVPKSVKELNPIPSTLQEANPRLSMT